MPVMRIIRAPRFAVAGGGTNTSKVMSESLTLADGKVSSYITGNAPAWFVSQTDSTWLAIAGSGKTISDVYPSPIPNTGLSGENPTAITAAWTGGCVAQNLREYIFAANGGHADYPGNEVYALSLGDAVPAWRRIADPTPDASMLNPPSDEGNGLWSDGRPRGMHNTFQVYGNGKVWFPALNAVSSPGGGFINNVASFDRASLGAASSPLAHNGSTGPWAVHGAVSGLNATPCRFGRGLYDPVNGYVYGVGGLGANNTPFWRFHNSTPSSSVYHESSQSVGNFGTWAVCAYDLGIIVAGDALRQTICVLPIANFGNATPWVDVGAGSGSSFFDADEFGGAGGAYIPGKYQIAIGNPIDTGKVIHKLQIPTTAGAYNPAGTWTWTTITPAGATTPTNNGLNGSANSKWNIVENMGNGQAAIVFCGDVAGSTYVYKVPVAGL